jgi:hypothetical protein
MCQQYVVDAGGIEAEWRGIFLVQLAAALMEPAVNQDTLAGTFDQMTGPGDTAIGTMERQLQVTLLRIR